MCHSSHTQSLSSPATTEPFSHRCSTLAPLIELFEVQKDFLQRPPSLSPVGVAVAVAVVVSIASLPSLLLLRMQASKVAVVRVDATQERSSRRKNVPFVCPCCYSGAVTHLRLGHFPLPTQHPRQKTETQVTIPLDRLWYQRREKKRRLQCRYKS